MLSPRWRYLLCAAESTRGSLHLRLRGLNTIITKGETHSPTIAH